MTNPPDVMKLWGKSSLAKGEIWQPSMGPPLYKPSILHNLDAAFICGSLWDLETPGFRRSMTDGIGLDHDHLCRRFLQQMTGLHDTGKVSPVFVDMREELRRIAEAAGFEFSPNLNAKAYHGIVSTWFLYQALTSDRLGYNADPEIARVISGIDGGHHGKFVLPSEVDDIIGDPDGVIYSYLGTSKQLATIGDEVWDDARWRMARTIVDLLGGPIDLSGISPDAISLVNMAGIITVSDWISSDDEKFPMTGGDLDLAAYVAALPHFASSVTESLGFRQRGDLEPLPGNPLETFDWMYHFENGPNALQRAGIAMAPSIQHPCMIIIEDAMGNGKTELALLIAAILMHSGAERGLFYGLPTQAMSNAMLKRIIPACQTLYTKRRFNLHLSHSDAYFIPSYIKLRKNAWNKQTGGVADGWFASKGKTLIADATVGTIDQMLMGILQARHNYVRMYGLHGKVSILDEIHSYDPYMRRLIVEAIRWQRANRCSIIVLSATLPKAQRRELVQAFGGDASSIDDAVGYPRITHVDSNGKVRCYAV